MEKKIIDKEKKKREEIFSDPVKFKNEIMKEIDEYCRKANRLELSRKFGLSVEEVEQTIEIIMNNQEVKELMIMAMGNI
jgi:hypothetical protein